MSAVRPLLGAVCALAFAAAAAVHAAPKAHPDSRTGHGAAADKWYIKNTETVANCGGPVGTRPNGAGGTTHVCRVGGQVVEVEKKTPPGKGQ